MDSGEYIHTGHFYYKCKQSGTVFNQSDAEIEYQHCVNR